MLTENLQFHDHSKHIAIKVDFVPERVATCEIQMLCSPTFDMV